MILSHDHSCIILSYWLPSPHIDSKYTFLNIDLIGIERQKLLLSFKMNWILEGGGRLLNWAELQNVISWNGAIDVFPRHLLSFPPHSPPPPPREQTPIYSSWGSALRQRRAVPPTGDQMERGSGLEAERPIRGSVAGSPALGASDRPDHRWTQFRFSIDANQAPSNWFISRRLLLLTWSDQDHLTHWAFITLWQRHFIFFFRKI